MNAYSFFIFLTNIINYNLEKNSFELDYDNFFETYNIYKSSYSFYNFDSFIERNKNNKEYFKFNWDVYIEKENITKNYLIKIFFPKMKVTINNKYNKKSIFYANIDTNKLCYFLKNNFLNWDEYIINFFSEFKLFRFTKNSLLSAERNSIKNNENNKENIKELEKVRYNLNKTNVILNNIKINNKSYEFFFTKFKNNKKGKSQNYFFQIKLPKIIVNYKDRNISINKNFDLDIKTMIKLNKLRKSFNIKDIIRYCLIYVKGKNKIKNKYISSPMRKINSSYDGISKKMSSKLIIKYNINNNQIENIKPIKNKDNNIDNIIDIKLNLNENIFNFDKDILKFIKPNKNDNIKYNEEDNIDFRKSLSDRYFYESNQHKKLNIDIEKIQLNWIDNKKKIKNIYKFEDKEAQYIFDHSSFIWRKYIEKNINKIISSSIEGS